VTGLQRSSDLFVETLGETVEPLCIFARELAVGEQAPHRWKARAKTHEHRAFSALRASSRSKGTGLAEAKPVLPYSHRDGARVARLRCPILRPGKSIVPWFPRIDKPTPTRQTRRINRSAGSLQSGKRNPSNVTGGRGQALEIGVGTKAWGWIASRLRSAGGEKFPPECGFLYNIRALTNVYR
jgi:hypothetical protein